MLLWSPVKFCHSPCTTFLKLILEQFQRSCPFLPLCVCPPMLEHNPPPFRTVEILILCKSWWKFCLLRHSQCEANTVPWPLDWTVCLVLCLTCGCAHSPPGHKVFRRRNYPEAVLELLEWEIWAAIVAGVLGKNIWRARNRKVWKSTQQKGCCTHSKRNHTEI